MTKMASMPADWSITQFSETWAEEILSWATSADEVRMWTNLQSKPDRSVFSNWHTDASVEPAVLCRDKNPVAYGEVWIDTEANEVEIARIIVNPQFRSRGIGAMFASLLCVKVLEHGLTKVILRVIPDNFAAIACYTNAGFRRVSLADEQEWNLGQPVEYLWFQRNL